MAHQSSLFIKLVAKDLVAFWHNPASPNQREFSGAKCAKLGARERFEIPLISSSKPHTNYAGNKSLFILRNFNFGTYLRICSFYQIEEHEKYFLLNVLEQLWNRSKPYSGQRL